MISPFFGRHFPSARYVASQRGNIFAMLFAAVALTGVLASVGMQTLTGPVTTITRVTQKNIADTNLLMNAKIIVSAAVTGTAGGDSDNDGVIEPAAFVPAGGGETPPAGGGFLPTTLGLTLTDPWGDKFGYCVWDHGTTNTSPNRLTGDNTVSAPTQPVIAVVSAGPDKLFQTTCSAYSGSPVTAAKATGSDDIIFKFSYAEATASSNGLWTLNASDQAKAELKDSGGTANVTIDRSTGIGDFLGITTDTITAKLGTLTLVGTTTLNGGLKLDTDVNVTTCGVGQAGVIRYNTTTSKLEVCDGASVWKPAGTADATFITQTPSADLANEQALSSLATGVVKVTTGTGVLSSGTVDLSGTDASGTLAAARFPALTGEVTTSAGALVTTVADDVLDFSKFKDAMTLDAATDIAVAGTNVLSVTNTGTGNSLVVSDQASDSTPFVIDASGNVGLGTSTPGQLLDVYGNARVQGGGNLYVRPTVDGNNGLLQIQNSESANLGSIYGAGTSYLAVQANGAVELRLRTVGAADMRFETNGTDRMRIASTGYVGIGTISPKAMLEVNGGVKVAADASCSAAKAGTIAWNTNKFEFCDGVSFKSLRAIDKIDDIGDVDATSPIDNQVIAWDAASGRWIAKAISGLGFAIAQPGGLDGQVQFNNSGALSGAADVYYDSLSGYVGMGTGIPKARLDIAGGLRLSNDTDICPGPLSQKLGTIRFTADSLQICRAGGWTPVNAGANVADGDKGDITVSAAGTTWTVDDNAITYAKLQTISSPNKLLGRKSSGAGPVEEIEIGPGLSLSGGNLTATTGTISVTDYGASCFDAVDDSAAFYAALSTGRDVHVPACPSGSYTLASTVEYAKSGPGARLFCDAGAKIVTNITNGPAFYFRGDPAATGGSWTNYTRQTNLVFSGCEITGSGRDGIELRGVYFFDISRNNIHNLSGSAIVLTSSLSDQDGVQQGSFTDNTLQNNAGNGVSGVNPGENSAIAGLVFRGNVWLGNGGSGVKIRGRGLDFINNGGGWNGDYSVHLVDDVGGSSRFVYFRNNENDANAKGGIYLEKVLSAILDNEQLTRSPVGGLPEQSPWGVKIDKGFNVILRAPRLRIQGDAPYVGFVIGPASTGVRIENWVDEGIAPAATVFNDQAADTFCSHRNQVISCDDAGNRPGVIQAFSKFNGYSLKLSSRYGGNNPSIETGNLPLKVDNVVASTVGFNVSDSPYGNFSNVGLQLGTSTQQKMIFFRTAASANNIVFNNPGPTNYMALGTFATPSVSRLSLGYSPILGATQTEVFSVTDSSRVGINTATPEAALDVRGGIRAGADALCSFGSPDKTGTLAYNGGILLLCTSSGWIPIASAAGLAIGAPTGSAGGDLGGSYPSPSVLKINGAALGSTTATAGNLLIGSGTQWASTAVTGDVTLTSGGIAAIGAGKVTNTMLAGSIDLATKATGILPVANGGTGTSTGSITGTGALTFAAGATNQNITLTPSGTGYTILNGNVGIGTTAPGSALDVKGFLRLSGSTSGYVGFAPAAVAGSTTYTLPSADGASGQVLSTNGSATLSWTTVSGAPTGSAGGDLGGSYPSPSVLKINGAALGSTTATAGNLLIGSGTQWASTAVTGDVTLTSGGIAAIGAGKVTNTMLAGSIDLATKATGILPVANGGTGTSTGSITGTGALTFAAGATNQNITLTPSGTGYTILNGNVGIGTTAPGSALDVKGFLRLSGSTSGYVGFAPAAVAGSTTYTLPSADGASGQVLSTNGSATLSWTTVSGAPTGSAGGDLGGSYPSPSVLKINGAALGSTTATAGNLLIGSGTQWASTAVTGDVTLTSGGIAAIGAGKVTNTMLAGSIDLATKATGILPVANGGTGTSTGSITGTGALTFAAGATNQNITLTPSGTGYTILNGNVGIGTTAPGSALDVKGFLRLSGSTSGYVGFAPAAVAGSTTYTLPSADGASGQVLSTNGSATLSWTTVSGAPTGSAGGDLGGSYPSPSVLKINGAALGSTTATAGNLLIGSGTQWASTAVTGDVTLTSGGIAAIGAGKVTNTMLAGSIDLATKATGILPVANGGTGTSTGSITGTGALTFAAGATNQNITLTPSGTGYTILNGNVGIGTTTPGARLVIAGDLAAPAWGTSGIALQISPGATYTDSSSSGTVATNYVTRFYAPTLAASNPTTYSAAATLFIGGAPSAGSNVTITNAYSLFASGKVRMASGISLGGSQSNPSWSTSGPLIDVSASTLTDTTGSGTISTRVANSFGIPTYGASSSETITNAATVYIAGAPAAGSNTTITSAQALHVAGGSSYFGGNVGIGTTAPGSALDVKGFLRLSGSTSGYVGFAPAAVAGSTTYTLPSADGASGQVLSTNGSATLSWTTVSGAPTGSAGGDLGGSYPSPSVLKINGAALGSTTATAGNLLIGSGTQWASTAVTGDVTLTSGGIAAIGAGKVTNTMLAGSIDLATKATGILPVANGGTGTSTGSITGTGALTFAAGATNQNITLTPSGTGYTILNGNVGIGTTSPAGVLDVNNIGDIVFSRWTNDVFPSALNFKKARGTSPNMYTIVQNNDLLAELNAYAANGTGMTRAAAIKMEVDATPGAADMPGRITFHTVADGGIALLERMRIDNAGNVGIGTTAPGSTLDVKGTLRLSGSTSGYVGFTPPAAAGSTTYTLPSADGTNGQVLSTNGSGTLAWSTGASQWTSGSNTLYYNATNGTVTKVVFLTSGSSWTVPGDWNSANNTIEVIGGGGAGASANSAGGGGGGAYSKSVNVSLTPGATVTVAVGTGGSSDGATGGDTFVCNSTSNCASIAGSAVVVGAKGGAGGTGQTGGSGGASASGIGITKYSGGNGGNGDTFYPHGGGGGGAAGPRGAGGNGGASSGSGAAAVGSGGGGGAGGGGSGTAGANGGNGTSSGGGAGGNNAAGSGGATYPGIDQNGAAGTNGGGGSGVGVSTAGGNGGVGGSGTDWDSTHGASGGGGGGAGNSKTGGGGGSYGGGGGGKGNTVSSGSGGQGIIVITYSGANQNNVGIGTNAPAYPLDVTGDIRTSQCLRYNSSTLGTCSSDVRLKRNIKPFTSSLRQLADLKPVTYFYNGLGGNPDDGRQQIGLIAQDVEKVIPELVGTQLAKLKPTDAVVHPVKTVNYSALTYMLINAVKELKADNDNLADQHRVDARAIAEQRDAIDELRREIDEVRKRIGHK